jgi:hypothetical protein
VIVIVIDAMQSCATSSGLAMIRPCACMQAVEEAQAETERLRGELERSKNGGD